MDVLRSTLQPLTHNLPGPIEDLATSLLGPACFRTLVQDLDLSSSVCLKLATSKALGLGIVSASSIVKLPQILNLTRSRSARGLSLLSILLETGSYLVTLAYSFRRGFAFSTYGETAMILVQNVVIAALVLTYTGRSLGRAAFVAAMGAVGYSLFNSEVVDMAGLKWLQAGAGVVGVLSKVPQVVQVWQDGSTGVLSAFTVFNYLAGSLSRIFTTLQEVDDKQILYSFIAGFLLNAVLALQMVYYWNTSASKKKGKKSAGNRGGNSAMRNSSGKSTGIRNPGSNTPTTRRRG